MSHHVHLEDLLPFKPFLTHWAHEWKIVSVFKDVKAQLTVAAELGLTKQAAEWSPWHSVAHEVFLHVFLSLHFDVTYATGKPKVLHLVHMFQQFGHLDKGLTATGAGEENKLCVHLLMFLDFL